MGIREKTKELHKIYSSGWRAPHFAPKHQKQDDHPEPETLRFQCAKNPINLQKPPKSPELRPPAPEFHGGSVRTWWRWLTGLQDGRTIRLGWFSGVGTGTSTLYPDRNSIGECQNIRIGYHSTAHAVFNSEHPFS